MEEQSTTLDRISKLEVLSLEVKRNRFRFPKTAKMKEL